MWRFAQDSKEYVLADVGGKVNGSVIDPTGDPVEIAIVTAASRPSSADWNSAGWETDSTTTPPTYSARLMIGPSSSLGQLDTGIWDVYVRVHDSSETPVLFAGSLEIY